jgi:uncharacterized membrane protein YfcA
MPSAARKRLEERDWWVSLDAGLLVVVAIVLAAGVLKGSIGFGAPLVAVPLLAPLVGTRTAIVLISLPLLVANAGVLLARPVDRGAIQRFVPLLATLVPMTFLGGVLLARVDIATLTVVVGIVTIAFVGITASGFQPLIPPQMERPLSALVGLVAGVLNGATSAPGPIFSLYLTGLRLNKRDFVYGITILLAVGNVAQVFTYWQQGLLVGNRLLGSAALVPAILLGQVIGLRIQDRLDPLAFRRVVLVVVAFAGLNLLARGLGLL